MKTIITNFKSFLTKSGYKESSIEGRLNALKNFLRFTESKWLSFKNLTESDVEEHLCPLRKRCNHKTYLKYICLIKLFYKSIGLPHPFKSPEKEIKYESVNVVSYLNYLKASGRSESTIKSGERQMTRFFKYFEEKGITEIGSIKRGDIEEYLEAVYDAYSYSAKSKGFIIYFIKDYFKMAFLKGMVFVNPSLKLKNPRKESKIPSCVPSYLEVKKIISVIPKDEIRDRAIIEILYGSALRVNEVTRLKLSDIDYEEAAIRVTDRKTKSERVVPFNETTLFVLKEYLGKRKSYIEKLSGRRPNYDRNKAESDSRKYLFISRGGFRMNESTVRNFVSKYVKRSGIEKIVTPHSFRHACAVSMLKGGAGIRFIQKMLGHSDINTTMIYTRLGLDDLKKAVDNMHPHGAFK